jgi:hypothetical protein
MSWYKQAAKSTVPEFTNSGAMQESWETNLGGYQRWVVDAYTATAYLTETKYKITIGITVNKVHLGTIMFQTFWVYNLKEMDVAKKTYKKVKETLGKIFDELADSEAPSSIYESMIRHDCYDIDPEHRETFTIPHGNYANRYQHERDWRSSIYGTRYPKPTEYHGF